MRRSKLLFNSFYAVVLAAKMYLFVNQRSSRPSQVIDIPACTTDVTELGVVKKGYYGWKLTIGSSFVFCVNDPVKQAGWINVLLGVGAVDDGE